MVYQVFARKWRPLTFEDVVDQDHVKTTLINAIKLNRIANAYIFAGPRGIGKTSIARILARALNCEHGPTPAPCNVCIPCKEIIEDRSMDVMEIDGASNRGIEDVRNIRENVKYAPVHGKYRIYIIDEVHMLTREAFNALLKTLEEPPSHVLFIFATTELQKIPLTILSRCQRFDFKRLPGAKIIKQLKKICEAEEISLSEEAMLLLAKRSEGSIRDAESLLDQLVSFCGMSITTQDVIDIIGMIHEDVYFSCTDAMLSGDIAKSFEITQQIFNAGYDPGEFINGLLEHFRNMMLVRVTGNARLIETSEVFQQQYEKIAAQFSEMDLVRIINIISDAEYQIKKSSQPLLKLEFLMSKLISLDRSVTLQQVLEAIKQSGGSYKSEPQISIFSEPKAAYPQEQKLHPPESLSSKSEKPELMTSVTKTISADIPAQAGSASSVISTSPSLPISLEMIQNRWQEFLEALQLESAVTGSFLSEGTPTAFKDGVIHIAFRPENGFHIHSIERNKAKVNKVLEKVFGVPLRFTCLKAESSPEVKSVKKIEREILKDRLQKILEREPIINEIIELFGAESISVNSEH
jgi:DNA polymerase-3 subunit gamma/tau